MRKNCEKIQSFFCKCWTKISFTISVSNTHFEQYVEYEGPNLERKEVCNEQLKYSFSSLKTTKIPRYDCISSNVIKSFSEEIFGIIKDVVKS